MAFHYASIFLGLFLFVGIFFSIPVLNSIYYESEVEPTKILENNNQKKEEKEEIKTTHIEKPKSRLLTHVECPSLFTRADRISDGTADSVHEILEKDPLSGTITYDRGSEFALWKMIEEDTNAEVYFADPHSPWQRGKNENINERLRRMYPKGTDFSKVPEEDIEYYERCASV